MFVCLFNVCQHNGYVRRKVWLCVSAWDNGTGREWDFEKKERWNTIHTKSLNDDIIKWCPGPGLKGKARVPSTKYLQTYKLIWALDGNSILLLSSHISSIMCLVTYSLLSIQKVSQLAYEGNELIQPSQKIPIKTAQQYYCGKFCQLQLILPKQNPCSTLATGQYCPPVEERKRSGFYFKGSVIGVLSDR